jgi:hypothetical protein
MSVCPHPLALVAILALSAPLAGQTARRAELIREVERVEDLTRAATAVDPAAFMAFPKETATVSQLEDDLQNLYVAAFTLAVMPAPSGPTGMPRIDQSKLPESLQAIDAVLSWIAGRSEQLRKSMHRARGPRADPFEAIRLRAGDTYWRHRRAQLIEDSKLE